MSKAKDMSKTLKLAMKNIENAKKKVETYSALIEVDAINLHLETALRQLNEIAAFCKIQ